MLISSGMQDVVLRFLDGEVDLGRVQLVDQRIGAGRNRGMELVLRALQMAVQLCALDGDILHLAGIDLVQKIGVADLCVLAHAGASLHHAPQEHEADEDKDPEHDRFNARIHQGSSFPAQV